MKYSMQSRCVQIYELVKILSNKIPVQKLDGVLKLVPALVRDDSMCTFPQKKKIMLLKCARGSSIF